MVRDKGLEWRFERSSAPATQRAQSLGERHRASGSARSARRWCAACSSTTPVRREKLRQRIDAAGRPGGLTRSSATPQRKGALPRHRARRWRVFMLISGSSCRGGRDLSSASSPSTPGCTARRAGARSRSSARCRTSSTSSPSASARASPSARRSRAWPSRPRGPLREEMQLVLRQIALGAPRRDAFDALRERNTSDGVEHLRHRRPAGRGARRAADRRARRPRARHAPAGLPARPPARAEGRAARLVVTTAVIAPGAVIIIIAGLLRQRGSQPPQVAMAGRRARPEVRSLVRLVLLFRLIALNVTIVELPGHPDQVPGVIAGLVLAAFASFLPLRYWDRWGADDRAAADLPGRSTWCSTSRSTPTWARPARSSSTRWARRCWRACCSAPRARSCSAAAMFVGYYALVVLSGNGLQELRAPGDRDIQALVVLPALYPLAAAGGRRRAQPARPPGRHAGSRWRCAEGRAAAGAERARVAREMHDSLGKTLYGIALAARGALAPREQRGAGRRRRRARPVLRRAGRRRGGARAGLRPALGHARPAARRRAGPLRARVVGAQRDRGPPARRRRRPAAPGHALRALLHRARGAGERRAPRGRVAGRRRAARRGARRRPVDRRRRRRHRRRAATRASCRPTATTGWSGWPSAASGSARRCAIDGERGAGTTVTVRLPSGDVRAAGAVGARGRQSE